MKSEELFKYIVSGDMDNGLGRALRRGLSSLSQGYAWAVNRRNRGFDQGKGVYYASLPVISVGNITAGGTGKTPMVRYICERLAEKGYAATVLSRGYRAKDNSLSLLISDHGKLLVEPDVSGDEAWLLAKALPAASVVIGRSRTKSAQMVEEGALGQVLVLDDGFQHRALSRDLDIVLIDATNPFGYGHCLPRGLLREPLEGLTRAQAIVLTKVDQAPAGELAVTKKKLEALVPDVPIAETIHQPRALYDLRHWLTADQPQAPDAELGRPVLAATGIGNPQSFGKTLQSLGYDVKSVMGFGDHHDFTNDDLVAIWKEAFAKGAQAIMITEKDAVKICQLSGLTEFKIPIYVLSIGIHFLSGAEDLNQLIYKTVEK